jgi:hypothetical protein
VIGAKEILDAATLLAHPIRQIRTRFICYLCLFSFITARSLPHLRSAAGLLLIGVGK